MGVSVRLSRNTRVYLPFWLAIPMWLLAAAVWVVIGLVWLLVMAVRLAVVLVTGSRKQAGVRARVTETVEYERTDEGTDRPAAVFRRENLEVLYLRLPLGPVNVPAGTWVTITHHDGSLLELGPGEIPPAVAARRAAQADHDARTYRATVAECHIDGIKGGSFAIEAEGRDTVKITVQPDTALRFLSLRNGDIVQITLAKDQAGVESFYHLSRANGAKPRSPADFGPGTFTSRRTDG